MDRLGKVERPHVGLDEFDGVPPLSLEAFPRLRQHPRREVHADDAARRSDGADEVRQVRARPASEVHGRVAGT